MTLQPARAEAGTLPVERVRIVRADARFVSGPGSHPREGDRPGAADRSPGPDHANHHSPPGSHPSGPSAASRASQPGRASGPGKSPFSARGPELPGLISGLPGRTLRVAEWQWAGGLWGGLARAGLRASGANCVDSESVCRLRGLLAHSGAWRARRRSRRRGSKPGPAGGLVSESVSGSGDALHTAYTRPASRFRPSADNAPTHTHATTGHLTRRSHER